MSDAPPEVVGWLVPSFDAVVFALLIARETFEPCTKGVDFSCELEFAEFQASVDRFKASIVLIKSKVPDASVFKKAKDVAFVEWRWG